jgi:hypothetical protein
MKIALLILAIATSLASTVITLQEQSLVTKQSLEERTQQQWQLTVTNQFLKPG